MKKSAVFLVLCAFGLTVLATGQAVASQGKMISGFPAANEQEAKLAQEAFDMADKGKPDPAWKGKEFTIPPHK